MDDRRTTVPGALDELRDVAGTVVRDGDPDYDEARRVWNGLIDKRPAAVVRAGAPEDVAPAIAYARRHDLPLAVRGGGHGVAGNGTVDGGVVIDLAGLRTVEVDPEARTVRVGGGATWGDVDRATVPFELAVPGGVVSTTGVGGLTLGGGVGWLTRPFGLSIDSLLGADVVTADGRLVHVNEAEHPDLYWGLRGGGGNFGVVTSFTFRAHPLPATVYAGNLIYARPHWEDALRAWDTWTREIPDEMQSIFSFIYPPPDAGFGEDPFYLLAFAWASPDQDEGARLVEPLRRAAPPDMEEVGPTPWVQWQSAFDPLIPRGTRCYMKNVAFDRLDAEVAGVLVRRTAAQTLPVAAFDIHHMGGAAARVPAGSTPFPARSSRFLTNMYAFWFGPEHDEQQIAYTRALAADMAPFATVGSYVNFVGQDRVEDWRAQSLAAYGQATLDRLVEVKRAWDPENVFRLNHNIPPG
ncbi:FAD-binding oxidoreductase [Georgenia sp. SYP-B2076]|uniref:FAD-binding oxidoreductase n=1 Tax=Georgenia sp. SYP-B2076 TaxID=2495881 RepID=UPI000F8E4271|nr:FAD-binding oxidoreductase [Georgenia sp. SYP-B2076]